MSLSNPSGIDRQPPFQPFQCSICQSRFTRQENLKRHAALHSRSSQDAALQCKFCSCTFSRADLRHRHIKRKHPEQHSQIQTTRTRTSTKGHSPTAPVDADSTSQPSDGSPPTPGGQYTYDSFDYTNSAQWRALRYSQSSGGHDQHHLLEDASPKSMTPLASSVPLTQLGAENSTSTPRWLEEVLGRDESLNSNPSFTAEGYLTSHHTVGSFGSESRDLTFDIAMFDGALSANSTHTSDDWYPSEEQITLGCDLFFRHVSHFIPFLHQPTFDSAHTQGHLLLSILALAYQYGDDPSCTVSDGGASGPHLSLRCFTQARLLVSRKKDSAEHTPLDQLALVQTHLLLELYAMLYQGGKDSAYGLQAHSKMISYIRSSGLMLSDEEPAATPDLDSLWRQFISAESRKRTVFVAHQLDSLWYQFLSIPRLFSHLEIKHQLPCPGELWNAPSSSAWAHQQLAAAPGSGSLLQYSEAIRLFLSVDGDADTGAMPSFDSFGAINITQFLISSAREVSGWSTMTGRLSMERLDPLRSSLLAIRPFIHSRQDSGILAPLCEATWEAAMIELQLWSPSHTGGIVEESVDAYLRHLTKLTPSLDFLLTAAGSIQAHLDWFLRYLDTTVDVGQEAPWIAVYAYKAFVIAWQLLRGGAVGTMQAVGIQDGEEQAALAWATKVFRRRERRQLGRTIMECLDTMRHG